VCQELVEDIEALGGMDYVDREWPDMAVTYEHALVAIAKAKYEERRAAPAQDVRDAAITPFREACMRAWVDGWNAGLDDRIVQSDDDKRHCASRLVKEFPAENAAQGLLEASRKALRLCRDAARIEDAAGREILSDGVETALEDAIAKAEGEKP